MSSGNGKKRSTIRVDWGATETEGGPEPPGLADAKAGVLDPRCEMKSCCSGVSNVHGCVLVFEIVTRMCSALSCASGASPGDTGSTPNDARLSAPRGACGGIAYSAAPRP